MKDQPLRYRELEKESDALFEKGVALEDEAKVWYARADAKHDEADKFFDWEIYWEGFLVRYPHLVRVKDRKDGTSSFLRIKEYEGNREYWDKKAEIIGYGR